MSDSKSGGEYLRFRWSHRHPLHLALVRLYNACMRLVPFRLKYWVGALARRSKPPYNLPKEGWVVVQVGAPRDTLRAGRSRGMYFALLARKAKRIVIVEPDPASARAFEEAARRFGLDRVVVCQTAAWSKRGSLQLRFKRSHPAAGFVEGCASYADEQLEEFDSIEVPADRLDNVLSSVGEDKIDLLSITTNGAEESILEGTSDSLAAGIPYICLARTKDDYAGVMRGLGYELVSYDDRGFTFAKAN